MRNVKRYLIILFLLLLFSGCQNTSNDINYNNTSEIINNPDSLSLLNIVLPENWELDKSEKVVYKFMDEKGNDIGTVGAINYIDKFDLLTQKPNHSSVINDEYINIPLGKCRLITLDTDNGTAASGFTGTHDTYYASVSIKERAIYMLSFTKNNKSPETKNEFIEVLKNLSLK
ncbi:MAG: hypothetical protein K0Q65_2600 [Clostridia bacterium]|jgi:hypothetical protein|nr:hypothetical protein [Clostridia bacterium]